MRKPTKPIPTFSRSTTFLLLLLILSMATLLSLSLFLFLPLSLSLPSPSPPSQLIHQACNATRFPLQCHSTLLNPLSPSPPSTPLQLIHTATSASIHNLHTAQSMLNSLLPPSATNLNNTAAADNLATAATTCLQILRYSYHRTTHAAAALPNRAKDARAWMSAALAYQYGCWSGLKYVNHTVSVSKTMSFLDNLISLTSNALSMIANYDMHGNDTVSWTPPRTERDGVWEPGFGSSAGGEFRGGLPGNLKADVVVCKESSGKGCYGTVQEAVNAAPERAEGEGGWFVIHIKEGVYEEKVRIPLKKRNVVFLGDGMGKTVITGSASVGLQPGMTTYNSATVGVVGDGFMAKDLTIQNTAGPDAHQAVAFRSDSDLSVIENCEFISNQDTLYAHSLRQFYKSCRIIGNVDFIFGNSASIFQDCQILVKPRQGRPEKGENNAITAHGRTDPAQSTGFVFHNCLVNGTEEYMTLYNSKPQVHKNYLGRPWKEYSRTVFIHSFLESLIMPQGWLPWSADGFALNTLYYGEFENSGPGSNLTGRVPWSSKVPAEHVFSYSVQNFIQGNDWIPSSQ